MKYQELKEKQWKHWNELLKNQRSNYEKQMLNEMLEFVSNKDNLKDAFIYEMLNYSTFSDGDFNVVTRTILKVDYKELSPEQNKVFDEALNEYLEKYIYSDI